MARLFYGDGIFVNLSGQNQRGKTTKKIIREHKTPKKLPSRPPSFLPTLPTQPDHLQEFRKIRNNNKNTLQKPTQKNFGTGQKLPPEKSGGLETHFC